jgi:hypothetical protein
MPHGSNDHKKSELLIGTGLTMLLAILGAYLLLFRWPLPVEKQ